jgi:Na+-driven multidrug efflux pump
MSDLISITLVTLRFALVGLFTIGTSFLITHFTKAHHKHPYKRFIVMGWISGIIGLVFIGIVWFYGLKV